MKLNDLTDTAMEYGRTMLKGLVSNNTPVMAKGMLNELLRINGITPEVVTELVMENKSLWDMFPENQYDKIKKILAQVGEVDWITTDWLIDATRKNHPALASLFLGWRKARNWLDRQVEEIKAQVKTLT